MKSSKGILSAFVVMALVQFCVTGCGAQGGQTVMTQGANAQPVNGTAPQSGEYAVYTAASPNPTATVRLNQGDPLGWRRADDGHLVAYAKDQTFDLPHGTAQAYWKLQDKK